MSKKVLSVFLVLLAMVLMFTSSIPVIAANTGDTGVSNAARASTIKITAQPKSVVVAKGKTATVSFKATGEGLTYTWYYRDATASSFKKTTTFSGNTYTATMNAARSGREIYCVVKDKTGNSVKTNIVTISMENSVQITSQPKSVIAPKGSTATLQVKAKGDGLTYKWYYKDTGMSAFKKTDTFKGNPYTAEMASKRDGRQIYCVITDKNGCSVKTQTVTLTIGNPV